MFEKLETELKLRGYSPKTRSSYITHNKAFLEFIKKGSETVTEDDIKLYLAHLVSEKKLAPASIRLAVSSLRFFYEELLKKPIFEDIHPPNIDEKMPVILTKDEIKRLISNAGNKKSTLIIKLLYSTGLRLSECANLKVNDLELDEKIGWVRHGKGAKDRAFTLSDKLIKDLKKYIKKQNLTDYLFPGSKGMLSTRNIQKIVKNATQRANINKKVSPHTLRHSFATHLHERGVSIRTIQKLLGHKRLSTTQIYTTISLEEIKKVKNPLDDLKGL